MKKLSIYLDTSIISFYFAEDAPFYQQITRDFFHNYIDDYDVYISEIVMLELRNTNDNELKSKFIELTRHYQLDVIQIEENPELNQLAKEYIKNGIIPESKIEDAYHIAVSVYHGIDILLSWNFKHLANIQKQIQINALNTKLGYLKPINLFNPMEVEFDK